MSVFLYLAYILDITYLFTDNKQTPETIRQCNTPTLTTYIDDNLILRKINTEANIEEQIVETINKVNTYNTNNKLKLNPQKTKIMMVTNDKKMKDDVKVTIQDKTIKHSTTLKILGLKVSDDLRWENHTNKIIIPRLTNQVRSIGMVAKFMPQGMRARYVNVNLHGHIEIWYRTMGRLPEKQH